MASKNGLDPGLRRIERERREEKKSQILAKFGKLLGTPEWRRKCQVNDTRSARKLIELELQPYINKEGFRILKSGPDNLYDLSNTILDLITNGRFQVFDADGPTKYRDEEEWQLRKDNIERDSLKRKRSLADVDGQETSPIKIDDSPTFVTGGEICMIPIDGEFCISFHYTFPN